jgi:hypothetical protein
MFEIAALLYKTALAIFVGRIIFYRAPSQASSALTIAASIWSQLLRLL